MSIRFAAARTPGQSPACSPVAQAMARKAISEAANDNGDASPAGTRNDEIMKAALRHFAQHGLGAARAARAKAEAAFFEGDRQSYDWWRGITRALDRRMAAQWLPQGLLANFNSDA